MNINVNTADITHNTTIRGGSIKYIVIHYVGATGTAKQNIVYYSQPFVKDASADYYVSHDGEIWQYNPNPQRRYCWAVGGGKQSKYGGTLHGIVRNHNSISIEMCVKTRGNRSQANHPDWYLTMETINATVELTKMLMRQYGVPAENVVRHFDVTGKLCPGVVGWNYPSGSEDAWVNFKKRIGGTHTHANERKVQTVKVELPVLKRGMKGEAVKTWQHILVANGYDPKGTDGSFGYGCDKATRAYQKDHGLTVDGQVGPEVYGSIWPLK